MPNDIPVEFEDDLPDEFDDSTAVERDDDELSEIADDIADGRINCAIERLRSDLETDAADQMAHEVADLLSEGRRTEAALRLDRFIRPKFPSLAVCRERYAAAMAARDARVQPSIFEGIAA